MENKEIKSIEEILKKAADEEKNIQLDDFDTRWRKIENELMPKNRERHKEQDNGLQCESDGKSSLIFSKNKIFIIASVFCILILSLAIILPICLSKTNEDPNIKYFNEENLTTKIETVETFYAELDNANIYPVDLSDFYPQNYKLVVTESLIVKGGIVEMYDGEDEATVSVLLRFYDSTVRVKESSYNDYDLSYSTNTAEIKYKLTEYANDFGVETWRYDAVVWHDDLFYRVTYYSIYDNILDFFNALFN